jgi:hypothetical protein
VLGACLQFIKKLWKSYKIAGRTGEPRADIAYSIRSVQSALGIGRSEFPELEGMYDEDPDRELTAEEIQLRREEAEEDGGWDDLNFGTSERSELEPYPEEWSDEDEQLCREEWWFS